MKHLLIALFLAPTLTFAAGEQCEPLARQLVKDHFDAMVHNAKEYHHPEDQKYLACEGQPLHLDSVTYQPNDFGYMYYNYIYSIECGMNTFRWDAGYYIQDGRCVLRGE
jgi:hypothetical protein